MMNFKSKKGFTLVELIIVIAILGIIALIAVPSLTGVQKRSQVNADVRTAEQIGKAVRVWLTDGNINETRAREAYIRNQYMALTAMDTDTVKDVQANVGEGLEDYISLTYQPNLAGYNYYVGLINGKVTVGIGETDGLTYTSAVTGASPAPAEGTSAIYEYPACEPTDDDDAFIAYVEGISTLLEENVKLALGMEVEEPDPTPGA